MANTTYTDTRVSKRTQEYAYLRKTGSADVTYNTIEQALQAGIALYDAMSETQKTAEATTPTIKVVPFSKIVTTTVTTTTIVDGDGKLVSSTVTSADAVGTATERTATPIVVAIASATAGRVCRDGTQGAIQHESNFTDVDNDGVQDKYAFTYKLGTTWASGKLTGVTKTVTKLLKTGDAVPSIADVFGAAPSGHTFAVKSPSSMPTVAADKDVTILVLES